MPVVTIRLARRAHPAAKEQKAALITGVTTLLLDVLGNRREDVTVLIDEIDPENWGQGGASTTVLRRRRGGGAGLSGHQCGMR